MVAHTWGWPLAPGDGRFTCEDAQKTDGNKTRREFLLAIVRCCFSFLNFLRNAAGRDLEMVTGIAYMQGFDYA